MSHRMLLLGLTLLMAGCAQPVDRPAAAATAAAPAGGGPTRRQLDSVVARSGLPGSQAVGKALDVAGMAEKRAAALDTIH